jgi:hypothetical protein
MLLIASNARQMRNVRGLLQLAIQQIIHVSLVLKILIVQLPQPQNVLISSVQLVQLTPIAQARLVIPIAQEDSVLCVRQIQNVPRHLLPGVLQATNVHLVSPILIALHNQDYLTVWVEYAILAF